MDKELSRAAQQTLAVEARDLTVVRGNRTLFRDVALALAPGEIVALLGCNGAGKTTLLHCLAGILRPASGEVFWQGDNQARARAIRTRIGFVGHESGLYPALTVFENLVFAGRMWGIAAPKQQASSLLSSMGLADRAAQPTGQLSRGMRQRVAIARAVIHDPDVLLLDEPFTSLDAEGRDWLVNFLCELRARHTSILFSTHEPVHAGAFMDRSLTLGTNGLREMHAFRSADHAHDIQTWQRSREAALRLRLLP